MPRDMRTWISELEEANELIHIRKPVDPQQEMGALLYQSREKALLFEDLPGYPGWRSLGMAPANLRQAALAFSTPLQGLVPRVAELMDQRLPCESADTGPVKDVILIGKDADLNEVPVHIAGAGDAGPFIASGLVISRDRDTGRRNMSFHRMQIKGPRKTGLLVLPRHTFTNLRKYEERGEAMPVAIVVGHHPLLYMAAATTGPYGMDELEVAGGYLGEPLRLVKCETVDLEVPFDAEMVLEGHILPGVREAEGPFSEFQDYYVAGTGNNPVIEITAITRRRDPIFKAIQNGSEVEGCMYHKVPMSATLFRRLRAIGGQVDLKNVIVTPGIFGVAVQMTPRFYGEARQVLLGALASEYLHPKVAIAVDEDVDIFNNTDLMWALATRVEPTQDITVIPGLRTHPMDPTGSEIGATGQPGWQRFGGKVIIDATKPPVSDPAARALFERIKPANLETVRLQDYID